ncbi:MAG: hypothetical protein MPJ50_18850 [Pirellulales bacterium]|nr:hypothetical protein [Pirellulales bacterium]
MHEAIDQYGRSSRTPWRRFHAERDGDSWLAPSYDKERGDKYTWNVDGTLDTREYIPEPGGESFTYDLLGRLERTHLANAFKNGKPDLNASSSLRQVWKLDQSGNWREWRRNSRDGEKYKLDASSGESHFSQKRKHTPSNRISKFFDQSTIKMPAVQHDAAGNMTSAPSPLRASESHTLIYDGWGRVTEIKDAKGVVKRRYTYDGLGRMIVLAYGNTEEHYYYDKNGQVISTYLDQGSVSSKSPYQEYIYDVHAPDQIVALREGDRSYYPIYDVMGRVKAVIDEEGNQETYEYDAQGHVYKFGGNALTSRPRCEFLVRGMLYDVGTGYFMGRSGFYNPTLGRHVATGGVSVLSEATLNARAMGFPTGTPVHYQSAETQLQSLSEEAKWAIGGVGILLAIGAIAFSVATFGVGTAVLVAATGVAAAVSAGVDAAMEPGATGGDIFMAAGMSAGAAAPLALANPAIAATSAVTSIVGSLAGYGISQDRTGWQIGGLIGGIGGGALYGTGRNFAEFGLRRAAMVGLATAAPELIGAGVGAAVGYWIGGTSTSAWYGAMAGMLIGGVIGSPMAEKWCTARFRARPAVPSRGLLDTTLAKDARRYLRDIEQQTGLAVHPSQRTQLADHLRANSHSRLSTSAGETHRRAFNSVKDDLIAEWQHQTGQVWPRYTQQVVSQRTGRVLREVGGPFDAHHIIENVYEGPHTWWNIHPAEFPGAHQGGIHRAGGVLREIMP